MHVKLAYLAAVVSSISFGLASVTEHRGASQTSSLAGFNLRNIMSLRGNPWYLGGLILDGVGYLLFIFAVRVLPLFFVQAVGTASILVTAFAARFLLGSVLTRRDHFYIMFILLGLTILGFASGPEPAVSVSFVMQSYLVAIAVCTFIGGVLAGKFAGTRSTLLALISGFCFSSAVVLTRIVQVPNHWWQFIINPSVILIVLNGVLGLVLFTTSLQHSPATIVYSTSFVTEMVLPTLVGLVLLGDRPLNHRWYFLVIGLVITLLFSSLLTIGKEYLNESSNQT